MKRLGPCMPSVNENVSSCIKLCQRICFTRRGPNRPRTANCFPSVEQESANIFVAAVQEPVQLCASAVTSFLAKRFASSRDKQIAVDLGLIVNMGGVMKINSSSAITEC